MSKRSFDSLPTSSLSADAMDSPPPPDSTATESSSSADAAAAASGAAASGAAAVANTSRSSPSEVVSYYFFNFSYCTCLHRNVIREYDPLGGRGAGPGQLQAYISTYLPYVKVLEKIKERTRSRSRSRYEMVKNGDLVWSRSRHF